MAKAAKKAASKAKGAKKPAAKEVKIRPINEKFTKSGLAKHLSAEGKSGQTGKAYLLFGKIGYIGKGIAIAIVGGLILYGGITHDASKSGNLDQALHKVLTYPFGQVLLVLIAAGFVCYGLFCFARARHLST